MTDLPVVARPSGPFKVFNPTTGNWVNAPLATKRTETHSYAVAGDIASGTTLAPFWAVRSTDETLMLTGIIRQAGGGSGTVSVRRNGANAAGFANLAINTTRQITNPTPLAIATNTEIRILLASGSISDFMAVTLVFERTSAVAPA